MSGPARPRWLLCVCVCKQEEDARESCASFQKMAIGYLFTTPTGFLSFPFLVALKRFAPSLEPKISKPTVAIWSLLICVILTLSFEGQIWLIFPGHLWQKVMSRMEIRWRTLFLSIAQVKLIPQQFPTSRPGQPVLASVHGTVQQSSPLWEGQGKGPFPAP